VAVHEEEVGHRCDLAQHLDPLPHQRDNAQQPLPVYAAPQVPLKVRPHGVAQSIRRHLADVHPVHPQQLLRVEDRRVRQHPVQVERPDERLPVNDLGVVVQ